MPLSTIFQLYHDGNWSTRRKQAIDLPQVDITIRTDTQCPLCITNIVQTPSFYIEWGSMGFSSFLTIFILALTELWDMMEHIIL